MADYIKREALLEKAWDADTRAGYVQVVDVEDILAEPAADVVEVVRCGNCKFSEPIPENSGFYKGNWRHCGKWRGELPANVWHPKEKCWKDWSVTTPDGFCDDGEARDGNEKNG